VNIYGMGALWHRIYELGNQVGQSWRPRYELGKQFAKRAEMDAAGWT
jgi:hypothetical protein